MGARKTVIYETDEVRITHRGSNGADDPRRYIVELLNTEDEEYFHLRHDELFNVADALATICNYMEDQEAVNG